MGSAAPPNPLERREFETNRKVERNPSLVRSISLPPNVAAPGSSLRVYPSLLRRGHCGGRACDLPSPKTATTSLEKPSVSSGFFEALWRTRTADPLLTMEVLYQLS